MNPADFLAQLAARGVVVATDGADLFFEGPDAVLTEKVLDFMRTHKPALLQLVPEVVGFGPAGEPIPYPRCVDCGKALPRNQRRCPAGTCDRRPVASCRDFPPPGPVAPLGAPAGVEYEPGQDWQPEELAHAWCPGCGGGSSIKDLIPRAVLDPENPARFCGACRARLAQDPAWA